MKALGQRRYVSVQSWWKQIHLQLTKILTGYHAASFSSYLPKLYLSSKRFLLLYDGTLVMFGCRQSVLGNANAFPSRRRHLFLFFSLPKKKNGAFLARMHSIATQTLKGFCEDKKLSMLKSPAPRLQHSLRWPLNLYLVSFLFSRQETVQFVFMLVTTGILWTNIH